MNKTAILLLFFFSHSLVDAQTKEQMEAQRIKLPNNWSLTPVGKSLPLGDLPLNITISQTKKMIAVTNNGQSTQSIQLVDAQQDTVLDNIEIPKSWFGLKFSGDEKYLYASGGNDNWILKYAVINREAADRRRAPRIRLPSAPRRRRRSAGFMSTSERSSIRSWPLSTATPLSVSGQRPYSASSRSRGPPHRSAAGASAIRSSSGPCRRRRSSACHGRSGGSASVSSPTRMLMRCSVPKRSPVRTMAERSFCASMVPSKDITPSMHRSQLPHGSVVSPK